MISKGYRLRPWESPYIRWRLETFFGPQAESATGLAFFSLLWRERERMRRFVKWAEERRRAQSLVHHRSAEAKARIEEIRERPR
jgi:hypothetical protein